MFYRTISRGVTALGTKFVEVAWWNPRRGCDVTVAGVTFMRLTREEYLFFFRNF